MLRRECPQPESKSRTSREELPNPSRRTRLFPNRNRVMGWLVTGACFWLVDYRLWNDTSYWSYGGNNPTRQGGVAWRYDYYRLVGENEQGASYGDVATFTTAPAR